MVAGVRHAGGPLDGGNAAPPMLVSPQPNSRMGVVTEIRVKKAPLTMVHGGLTPRWPACDGLREKPCSGEDASG